MRGSATAHPTLISAVWPTRRAAGIWRLAFLAVAGSLLLTLSAKIQVPFWPVPMTMQTAVVLFVGAAFGPRLGTATVALYLIEGALGLPVFAGTPAKGIGLAYMIGPTGGYLAGFLAAAYAVGVLAWRGWDRGTVGAVAALVIGDAVIFAFGVSWLAALIGFEAAITAGLLPFLAGEALKIALAAALLRVSWRLLNRRQA